MKRSDFYKEYFSVTNRDFSDHPLWTKESREKAWQKGKLKGSKAWRYVSMVLQYCFPIGFAIYAIADPRAWILLPLGLFFYLITSYTSDFSFLKIELLYRLYNANTVYAELLHDVFCGNTHDFFEKIRRNAKKYISGYLHISGEKFYGKYELLAKTKDKIILIITYKNIKLKINDRVMIIDSTSLTKQELQGKITLTINEAFAEK